jgi:hypothetical protein
MIIDKKKHFRVYSFNQKAYVEAVDAKIKTILSNQKI